MRCGIATTQGKEWQTTMQGKEQVTTTQRMGDMNIWCGVVVAQGKERANQQGKEWTDEQGKEWND